MKPFCIVMIWDKPNQSMITGVTGNPGAFESTNPNVKQRTMFRDFKQKQS